MLSTYQNTIKFSVFYLSYVEQDGYLKATISETAIMFPTIVAINSHNSQCVFLKWAIFIYGLHSK